MLVVQLFAGARDAVGRGEVEVSIGEGCTAREVGEALVREFPELRELAGRAVLAVNQEFVGAEHPVKPGDEVALIPPISGG